MDNDDQIVGTILSRREALKVLGVISAASAAMLAGCDVGQSTTQQPTAAQQNPTPAATQPSAMQGATAVQSEATEAATTVAEAGSLPTCIVRPALTEGPYFVDEQLNRSDIRSDPSDGSVTEGTPLKLVFRVAKLDSNSCAAFEGVTVDVWHCDAMGVYSDVTDPRFDTTGKKYLRGYQVTDANGRAEFQTINPGWYLGRAVHIHFKLRTDPDAQTGTEFTSQLFFDDALNTQVFTQEPYASKGQPTMTNRDDGIFNEAGDQLLLTVTPEGDGYTAIFDIGLQMA
jgi:protocatechuate 3,4-dioxygenase beta subunit